MYVCDLAGWKTWHAEVGRVCWVGGVCGCEDDIKVLFVLKNRILTSQKGTIYISPIIL